MNSKIRIFLFCPVPESQKPISEFLFFQENSFFQWVTFSKKQYEKICFSLFILFQLGNFFTLLPKWTSSSLHEKLFSIFFSFFFVNCVGFFFFFFVFFRWSQLEVRFNDSRLVYEEGSWYEIQIWEKPLELIKNERLVTSQKIQLILERIFSTLFFLLFFVGLSLLFFFNEPHFF